MRIKSFARTRFSIQSLVLRAGPLLLALVSLGLPSNLCADAKADARDQFEQAVRMRTSLEGYLPKDRSLTDYKQTVAAYHRVYLISPRAEEVSPALIAEGELYEAMGHQFDPKFFDAAVEEYKFLLQQYPDSRYASDALFSIAQIEMDGLNEPESAQTDFKEFLRRFPRSDKTADAKRSLKELAVNRGTGTNPVLPSGPGAASYAASVNIAALPVLQGQAVEPQQSAGRSPFVKKIQTLNLADSARVIVTLDGTVAFKSAIIQSPERIYFDLQKAALGPDVSHNPVALDGGLLKSVHIAQNRPDTVRVVLDANGAKNYSAILLSSPYRLVIEVHAQPQPFQITSSESSPKIAQVKSRASLDLKNAALQPPTQPKPTRDGQRSLTRELGLKINRIVIDAGHGGYDTGTIGPHGLLEKDLCLDVALRLGALIEQKLPGADVIYTRKDDTFVPLEDRTAIANDAKADLFISIHANSSHDPDARGIETYYLNFSSSPDSMAVATRENSVSQQSVHDLQDLIRKIARNDKIEESKELAGDIQDSLTQRLQLVSRDERNRGVKKAPFVVLIGANMPSILSEISFVSNPSDERLLKKTDQRQRIADGLLRGITSYLGNLNSLSSNKQKLVSDNHLDGSPLASGGNPK